MKLLSNLSLKRSDLNSKGIALLEITIVIAIIMGQLMSSYETSKDKGHVNTLQEYEISKDVGRIKLLQEYETYYTSIKEATGQYPGANVVGNSTSTIKTLSKVLPNGKAVYKFDALDSTGHYRDTNLKSLQNLLVQARILGNPASIKQGNTDENMILFTSIAQKRMIGCIKLSAPNDVAANDGDGFTDTNITDTSKNGNRIFFVGDIGLLKDSTLGPIITSGCKDELVDPSKL